MEFVSGLKSLTGKCEFTNLLLNDILRDRFICGLRAEHIKQKMIIGQLHFSRSRGRCNRPKNSVEGCTTLWRKSSWCKFCVGRKSACVHAAAQWVDVTKGNVVFAVGWPTTPLKNAITRILNFVFFNCHFTGHSQIVRVSQCKTTTKRDGVQKTCTSHGTGFRSWTAGEHRR